MKSDISCGGLEKEMVSHVEVMVREELCENMVEVRRVSDSDGSFFFFEEYVMMLICGRNWKKFERKTVFL